VIALDEELAWIDRYATAHPRVRWDRLLFSAKESIYKTWYPLTARFLEFSQAAVGDVTCDPRDADRGAFIARLRVPGLDADDRLASLDGRWLVRDGLVVTAIVVAR
jgi:4'-phosphopantetheinyl transferase EntD